MKRVPLAVFSALLFSLAAASAQNLVYQGRNPYSTSGYDDNTGTYDSNSSKVETAILLIGPTVNLLTSWDENGDGVNEDIPLSVHPFAVFNLDAKQKTVLLYSAPAITQKGGPGNYSLSGPAMTVDAVKLDSAAKKVIMDMDFNWAGEDTHLGDGWADELSGPAKFGKPVPSASSPIWFASTLASEPTTSNVDVHPLDDRGRGRPAADQPIPGAVSKDAVSYTLDPVLTKQVFSLSMAEAISLIKASIISKGYKEVDRN